MDVSRQPSGTPAYALAGARADPSPGEGEPALGVCSDPGGAPRSRHPGGSDDHPDTAEAKPLRARSSKRRPLLVGVPSCPGRRGPGLRLLLGGDGVPFQLYVLFFIEIGTRRVHVMTSTRNPDAGYTTQQARNIYMAGEVPAGVRYLIRDRDSKFARSFDAVFGSEGARVILTPIRAPKANAFAERWVRTVRAEILDWTLVLSRRHLDRLLAQYASHYNSHRPHRGIALSPPDACGADPPMSASSKVHRREVLAGINEYLAA
jgi:transposase InsO family protein